MGGRPGLGRKLGRGAMVSDSNARVRTRSPRASNWSRWRSRSVWVSSWTRSTSTPLCRTSTTLVGRPATVEPVDGPVVWYLAYPSGRGVGDRDGSHISSQPPPSCATMRPKLGSGHHQVGAPHDQRPGGRLDDEPFRPGVVALAPAHLEHPLERRALGRPAGLFERRRLGADGRHPQEHHQRGRGAGAVPSSPERDRDPDGGQLAQEVGADRGAGGVSLDEAGERRGSPAAGSGIPRRGR